MTATPEATKALRVYGEWAISVSTLGQLADLEKRMANEGVSLERLGEYMAPALRSSAAINAVGSEIIDRLLSGVVNVGMHDDNSTELFDIEGANDTMAEAAAEIERLTSALAVRTPDWQPIATAPWDGGDAEAGRSLAPCILGKHRLWGFEQWVGQCDGGIWLGRDGLGACFGTDEPTHWRPLPAPPAAAIRSLQEQK